MGTQHKVIARVTAILLIPILVLGVVFVSFAVDGSDFENTNNLSRTGKNDRLSGPPQAAAKGNKVAVVWSDGFNSLDDTKEAGHIYLKSADTDPAKNYWRAKTFVFQANNNNWGLDPNFVFDRTNGNLVHVVWSQANSCSGIIFNCKFQSIVYRQCNVTDDVNTCGTPKVIATAGGSSAYVNPSITQDDDDDLHVIWQEEALTKQFRYSRSGDNGANWSGSVTFNLGDPANNSAGRDAKIFALSNRLHVIWDDQSENPAVSGVDKGIGYFFDSNDDDNSLAGTGVRYFVGSGIPFNESDADQNNPTITGKDNWLFVGYDVSNPDVSNRFGLFYVMSTDNGQTWSPAFNVPNSNITPLTQYESDMPDLGLKPSLALTSTGSTYRIHAVWNHLSGGTFSKRYRVFFSYIDLNQRIDLYGTKPTWQTPESVTDSDENSINPVLFITETGTPQGHIAYVEEEDVQNSTQDQYDVFYEGGVNGTIDPEYVIDEFDFDDDNGGDNGNGSPDGFKKVTPGVIETSSPSVSENLNYVLFFKNEGNLRAVGISVTDPIPANTTYNSDVATNISNKAVFNSGEVRWTGDVAPNTAVRITFSVKTNQAVPPTTVINTARMSSIGTGGAPFATSTAVTRIAGKFVFLPLVTK